MLAFLIYWLVQAAALFLTTQIVPGIHARSYLVLAVAALVIGFVNALVRPVLVLLSLPLTILTLGLFYFVVNGFCLMIAAALVPGFTVDGCGMAILGALVMSVIAWALNRVLALR